MKLHLNWDGNQNNGIIFNEEYDWGALFVGEHLKPKLSFEYDSFQYSEVFPFSNYVLTRRIKREITQEEMNEVKALAITWKQESGQEGSAKWKADKAKRKLQEEKYIKEFREFLATKNKRLTIYAGGIKLIEDMESTNV